MNSKIFTLLKGNAQKSQTRRKHTLAYNKAIETNGVEL